MTWELVVCWRPAYHLHGHTSLGGTVAFLHKLHARPDFMSSYLKWPIDEAIQVKCPMDRRIETLLAGPHPSDDHIRAAVDNPRSTRRVTYNDLNPTLSRYSMYDNPACPEYARISTTRLRLSSHFLRVECGRWARIPREQRTCSCDGSAVQDETHMLLSCPHTQDLRVSRPTIQQCVTLVDLFELDNVLATVHFCHEVMSKCSGLNPI